MATATLTPDQFMAQQSPPPSSLTPDQFMARQNAPDIPQGWAVRRPPLHESVMSQAGDALHRLATDPNDIPLDSYWDATKHGMYNIAQGGAQTVEGTLNLLDPRAHDEHEKAVQAVNPAALPVYRLFKSIGNTAEDAVKLAHEYHKDGGPTLGEISDVSGNVGGGIGLSLAPDAAPTVIKGIQGATDAAKGLTVTKATAPVRAFVKGANTVLAKAPGTVGTALGAGAGAMTHVPYGAEIGAGIGNVVGKELLPKVQIPGESVGLPKTVQGGPSNAPSVADFDAASKPAVAQPAAASAAPAVDTSRANVERLLNQATDAAPPLKQNVPLREQVPAAASPKTATPAEANLPEGFTPIKSSALQGYKYDPDTQHFEVITQDGSRYGKMGITPDQVAAFENAKSKGTAWSTIRKSPGVISTKNGVPRNVPLSARSASPDDVAPGEEEEAPAASPKAPSDRAPIYSTEYSGPEVGIKDLENIRDNTRLPQKVRDDARFVHEKVVDSGWKMQDAMDLNGTDALAKQLGGRMNKTINAEQSASSSGTGDEDLTSLLQESLKQAQRAKSGVERSMEDPAKLTELWGVDEDSLANTREQTRGMTPEQTEQYTQKLADAYRQGFQVEPLMETRDQYGNILEVDGRQRAIAAQRAGIKQVPVVRRYVKQ